MNRISQHEEMRRFLIEMGEAVCDGTQDILRCKSVAQRTTIHEHSGSDVIYSIDRDAEAIIVRMMEGSAGRFGGIVLVAEGIGKDEISCYPDGMSMEDARRTIDLVHRETELPVTDCVKFGAAPIIEALEPFRPN